MPRIRDIFKTGALFAFAFLFIAGIFMRVLSADAFIGPGTQSPGSGGGSFKLDASGSIGFGTPTAAPSGTFDDNGQGFGYVFTVASSTNPGLALRNLASGNMYLWSARNMGNLHLYRESSILPGKVLMDITPTGNVGISVFGPSERLEVGGNVKATAFVGNVSGEISAGNVTSDVFGSLGLGGSYAFPASLGVATSTKTGLPQNLSVYGGGYFSGSVGIGTTSPAHELDIYGDATNSTIRMRRQASYYWDIIMGADSTLSFNSQTGGRIMTLKHDGGVGIGTTGPGAKLDVRGNGNTFATTNFKLANSDGTTIFTVQDHSVGKFTGQFQVLGGAGANQLYVETGNVYVGSGAVGIGTLTPTTAKLVVASSTNGAAIDVVGGRIINVGTPTAASDATTKSYVDSVVGGSGGVGAGISGQTLRHNGTGWVASSLIYNNDTNVGIGTTSPTTRFSVSAAGVQGIDLSSDTGDTTNSARLFFTNASGSFVIMNAGGALSFRTGATIGSSSGTEYLKLLSGGNFGVGVSPSYKLDVVGTGSFTQPVIVGTPTAATHAATKSYVDSMFTGSGQWTTSGSNIYSSLAGNVGIGTTTPDQQLTIMTNGSSPQIHLTDTQNGGGIYIGAVNEWGGTNSTDEGVFSVGAKFAYSGGAITSWTADTTNAQIMRSEGGAFYFYGDTGLTAGNTFTPTARMIIDNSGNVGIGTTSPQSKLDFGTSVANQKIVIGTYTNNNFWTGIGMDTTTAGIRLAGDMNSATNPLVDVGYYTNDASHTWTSRVFFRNDGNVGIGTTGPGYKLDVVGTSQFSQPVIVGTPTATNHAATKSYVDSSINSGISGSTNYIPKFTGTNTIGNSIVTQQTAGTAITVGSYLSAGYSGSDYGSIGYGIAYTGTSGTWNYRNADTASKLQFAGGGFQFDTAPSGTAGNPITFTRAMTITQGGSVGIGTTSPSYTLDVRGGGTGYFANPVFVGTPTANGHAATKSYVDSILAGTLSGNFTTLSVTGTSTISGNWQLGGASLGNVNLNGYDIVGVNKITAAVIDPLYEIDGEKYATYGLDTVGLKTEITGKATLSSSSKYQVSSSKYGEENTRYSYTIDFDNMKRGSDLWVWYQTVEFSPEDMVVLATPYGSLAKIGYRIEGKTIVFFSDEQTEFSYRLSGKRHDWREWGTKRNTTEKASFILRSK